MQDFVWNPDPVLFSLGPVSVHWYGVLFASAIISGFMLMDWMYKKEGKETQKLESLQIYMIIGIVVGARLGQCFFYEPGYYLANPLKILAIHEGGLASHGGGIGAILAAFYYAKKEKISFLYLFDRLLIATALFGFFVRLGNFMNSEIIGTYTNVPWAVVFARFDTISRHPAQMYEALVYLSVFVLLFLIYLRKGKTIASGLISGLFLSLVFSSRIAIEFVKVRQASYAEETLLSAGQILSIPFLLIGLVLIFISLRKKKEKS